MFNEWVTRRVCERNSTIGTAVERNSWKDDINEMINRGREQNRCAGKAVVDVRRC